MRYLILHAFSGLCSSGFAQKLQSQQKALWHPVSCPVFTPCRIWQEGGFRTWQESGFRTAMLAETAKAPSAAMYNRITARLYIAA